jgi:hypothetical protein
MPKRKTPWQKKIEAIELVLRRARRVTTGSYHGGLADLRKEIVAALDIVDDLYGYPQSLLEELAKLVCDQFECETVTENHRAWARAYKDVFETGHADVMRRYTRSRRGLLSDGDVVRLRRRRSDGETLRELASAFKISTSMVSLISSGKRRASAGGPLTIGRKG